MELQESPFATATTFLAPLASLALPEIQLALGQLRYERGVFTAEWLASRPLPTADAKQPGQTVALADNNGFTRTTSGASVAQGHRQRPRTQVYESLHVRSDSWLSLVALQLSSLMRRDVVCTAYASHAGDRNLGLHDDAWTGVIVQISGAKRWLIWPTAHSSPHEIRMETGDVMILPQGMKHQVSTPDDPGHSLHLVFAVTARPIDPEPSREAIAASAA